MIGGLASVPVRAAQHKRLRRGKYAPFIKWVMRLINVYFWRVIKFIACLSLASIFTWVHVTPLAECAHRFLTLEKGRLRCPTLESFVEWPIMHQP